MASHEQSYGAGEAQGQHQGKTEQMMETMRNNAKVAEDKTHQIDKCGEGRADAGGLVQQTGEKVMQMAQEAKAKVADTFGMVDFGDDEEELVLGVQNRGEH